MKEKLCFIWNKFAYFTTAEDQCGDDWNDAPYEHNAGEPYEWREGDRQPKYEIIKVAFETTLETPNEMGSGSNSPYSVDMINAGAAAWLATDSYAEKQVSIPAGVSVATFTDIIRRSGGKVYIELTTDINGRVS